jgi:hypothetical protein
LNINLKRRVGTVCISDTETAQDSFYAAIVRLLEGDIYGCKQLLSVCAIKTMPSNQKLLWRGYKQQVTRLQRGWMFLMGAAMLDNFP